MVRPRGPAGNHRLRFGWTLKREQVPVEGEPVRQWVTNITTRNGVRMLGGLGILLFISIQLVPYGRAHTNPPVRAQSAWDSPRTQELFGRACADCHSNQTIWPWYSNVAPVSWLVQWDVDRGRAEFNVSLAPPAWGEAHEAAETVQEGEMPLAVYQWLHPEARLSPAERAALVQGLHAAFGGEQGSGRGR